MGQRSLNEWILGRVSGIPADFARADDTITNSLTILPKERKPSDFERTPSSLIVTSFIISYCQLPLKFLS